MDKAQKTDKLYSLNCIRLRLRLGLLKIYRHALISEDPEIARRRAPRNLIEELHAYRYRDPEDQKAGNSRWDDMPPDGDDDAIDTLCYIEREIGRDLDYYDEENRKPSKGLGITFGAIGQPEYLRKITGGTESLVSGMNAWGKMLG